METDYGQHRYFKGKASNGNTAELFMGTDVFVERLRTASISIQLPISPQYRPFSAQWPTADAAKLYGHS